MPIIRDIEPVYYNGKKKAMVIFECEDCKRHFERQKSYAKKQKWCSECASKHKATHGGKNTRLYNIYMGMKQRCNLSTSRDYKNYGGRNISICDEWMDSFENFRAWALNNGYDDSLTIDRIDNDGDYTPTNCRWATWLEQSRNKRNSTGKHNSDRVRMRKDRVMVFNLLKQSIADEYFNTNSSLMGLCKKHKVSVTTMHRFVNNTYGKTKGYNVPKTKAQL